MSNFRDRARAVKAAGEAERGNFKATGAPKRVYDYWLRETRSERGSKIRQGTRKENFCHFWRVVGFWGPLMWLGKTANRNDEKIFAGFLLALLAWFVFTLLTVDDFWLVSLATVGVATALFFSVGGFVAGVSAHMDPEERERADVIQKRNTFLTFGILGFPGFLAAYLLIWLVRGFDVAVVKPASKNPKVAAIISAVLVLTTAFITAFFIEGLLGIGVLAGLLLGAASLVALVILTALVVSDYVSGKRALARQARELYYETHGEHPEPATREPSLIARKTSGFFSGLGDFIVLIAQVIRVSKWKICPTVEIDT